MKRAERKALPSTLIPDMDNAIVGSLYTADYTGISKRVSPFFVAYFWKRGAEKKKYKGRGGAPCAFRKAMGTRVSG